MSVLITIVLNPVPDKLSPFHLALFLEISPVLSSGICFFFSSFWLLPCVCFYVWGRASTSPGLDRMALCSRCPIGHKACLPITQALHSRCTPCVHCVHRPVLVDLLFPLVSMERIDPQDDQLQGLALTTAEELMDRNWPRGVGLPSMVLWCLLISPLE